MTPIMLRPPLHPRGTSHASSTHTVTHKVTQSHSVTLGHMLQNITRFEGSAIAYAKGFYWVIFDSLRALGRVDLHVSWCWCGGLGGGGGAVAHTLLWRLRRGR